MPIVSSARGGVTRAHPVGAPIDLLDDLDAGQPVEIRGGKIAERRSHNAAVRRLARRLVTDHTKSLNEAAALARELHIAVPGSPTPSELWELQSVSAFRGRSFDHWYSSLEVYDHLQDIQETTDEISDGSNAHVRDDARTELPAATLGRHQARRPNHATYRRREHMRP